MNIAFFSSSTESRPVFKALKNMAGFEVKAYSSFQGSPPSAELFFVAHFDQLIPPDWFNSAEYGSLNLHFSLLPKYRGPAPIQWALIKGETEVGISVLKLSAQFDQGDIVWQKPIAISSQTTSGELYKKLFKISTQEMPQIIKQYIKGQLKLTTQPSKSPTVYARRLTKQDGFLSWLKLEAALKGQDSVRIHNLIRGLSPWPGVWTELKSKRLKVLKSSINTKNNCLEIKQVQFEGKQPISFSAFKAGYLT